MHAKVKPVWKWFTRNDPVKIFVVIVVLAFSFLSWYFSFRYATDSIRDLSDKVTLETVDKVSVYIENYLTAPITSISLSASLLSTRLLDPYDNSSALDMLRHSWDAIRLNPILRSYTISLPIPGYVGYIKLGGDIVQIADWYPLTEPYLQYYILTVDANGTANYSDSSTWIVSNPDININDDPQMQRCAANPDESFWNPPYIFPPSPDEVWIAFVKPIRDFFTGEFSSVVSCDFTVTSIGAYLAEIKPTENTKSMITDSDFNVIANSVGEFPFVVDPGNESVTFSAIPVAATTLDDDVLSKAAVHLPDIYAKMIQTGQNTVRTSFKHHGKQLLLVKRVVNLNLDWLVVLVVPNSDFFHKIEVARKTTIWISLTGIILSGLKILLDHRVFIAKLLGLQKDKSAISSTVSVEAFTEEEKETKEDPPI